MTDVSWSFLSFYWPKGDIVENGSYVQCTYSHPNGYGYSPGPHFENHWFSLNEFAVANFQHVPQHLHFYDLACSGALALIIQKNECHPQLMKPHFYAFKIFHGVSATFGGIWGDKDFLPGAERAPFSEVPRELTVKLAALENALGRFIQLCLQQAALHSLSLCFIWAVPFFFFTC